MNIALSKVYDRLSQVESSLLRHSPPYPIHKKLHFDNDASEDITDWIASQGLIKRGAHLLDAGCGNGFALIRFHTTLETTGVGLTISGKEARMGSEILKKLGLESDCRIIRQSYDEILHDQFDSILAIESLKHSQDLSLTFRSLSKSLKTGGNFIIVEDLATDDPSKHRYSYIYQRGWEVSRLFTRSDYEETLSMIGLEMVMEKDLTEFISLRSSASLERRIHRLKPTANLPFVGKYFRIYLAGLVQELFYALNSMVYMVMVFKKV